MTETLTLENTAIVLDSTCDAPPDYFSQEGVFLVPLRVLFGDEALRDRIDMTSDQFFARLKASPVLPTTSQPTAPEFAAMYEDLTSRYAHVFSLHISEIMSGTVRAASQAAEAFPTVEVFDLRTVSCALTLCAERVRARLARGVTLAELHSYLAYFIANSHLLFHAGTLEYLRRGGRIGRASSLVGGVLDILPLIQSQDGTLAAYAKVRGQKKAIAAVERFLEETTTPEQDVYYAMIESYNEDEANLMDAAIRRVRPAAHRLFSTKVGAVVGTHVGPGMAGFAIIAE